MTNEAKMWALELAVEYCKIDHDHGDPIEIAQKFYDFVQADTKPNKLVMERTERH